MDDYFDAAPPREAPRARLLSVFERLPYHAQILGGMLILQVAVLGASLAIVDRMQAREIRAGIQARLEIGQKTLRALLERRASYLSQTIQILAQDGALRKALADRDPKALAAMAGKIRARCQADMAWIMDKNGASYGDARAALGGGRSSATTVLDGRPVQMMSAPISGPGPLGAVAAAFVIDSRLARRLKTLSSMEVSFAARGRLESSTLDPPQRKELQAVAASLKPGEASVVGPAGRRQIVLPALLSPEVAAYAQFSLDSALEPLRRLQRRLLLIGCVGIALTALLGYVIAERFTKSLTGLIAELRRTNQDLARLNLFKTRFFAMVTHDIRNPVSNILMAVELLTEKIGDPKAAKFLESLERASKTILFLVSDLIDIAAIEAGALRMDFKRADLRGVLEDLAARFQAQSAANRVRFDLEIPSPLPKSMRADPDRILQAAQNLVSNALQYTPEGGTVALRAEPVEGAVRIQVSDTGIGIAPDDLPRVFQQFFRAENAKAIRSKGFGLGLSIVDEIVRAHSGTVSVKSELGKGTTFTVILPVLPA